MVNTVAVEKLEDFIQKWAEKVIEEETVEESKQDEEQNGNTKEEDGKENDGEEDKNSAEKQGTRGVFVVVLREFVLLTLSFYLFF